MDQQQDIKKTVPKKKATEERKKKTLTPTNIVFIFKKN